jgi:hypothetical protein
MFHPEDELSHQAARLRAEPTFADICRASVAAGDTNRLWLFRRKDGEERIRRMTLTAVPGEDGELTGYLATAEDVTEREKAHRAMLLTVQHQRTAVERLQELERVKGDSSRRSATSCVRRSPASSAIPRSSRTDWSASSRTPSSRWSIGSTATAAGCCSWSRTC